ncbi:hypothetical protein K7X08_004968 [Anisodus acutangulus]|uniref:RPM1 interacting protein 13 n=1 Tax=Anisodus acutangulus TaxID=402998 RepID=A0A9Q1MEF9_9SOLA|nr:hypothetical protein K7X08_004968 [Anisodus acutangulus]
MKKKQSGGAGGSCTAARCFSFGLIACRDYPHPRHLCAKFPFGSTPHERHCDQCHCYVCDTLAPCVYWGTGISSVAHCHATDKDKFWKAQRQSTRKSDKALPLVTPGRDTSVSVPPPVANQAPGFIPRLTNYYPPLNQTFRQAPIRPCSMPSSPGLPNSTRQRSTALRDKFHNHAVSLQLRNASINVNPSYKRHNIGHLGPQFFTIRTAFKRAGSPVQAFATDRSGYNSSNTCSVPQFGRPHCPTARWQVPCGSRPVVSSQSQVGNMYSNPLSSEAQMSSQQYAENSANSLHKQTSVAFHPEGGNTSVNTTASQYLLACPANAGTALGNSTTRVSQLSNHPDGETSSNSSVPCNGDLPSPATTDSTFVNRCENTFSCQPEPCRQSSSDSQNISQHGYQESLEVSRHPQLTESTTGLDKYDDWLFSGPSDVPFSTGFNILSPEAPPIESGFFVDL